MVGQPRIEPGVSVSYTWCDFMPLWAVPFLYRRKDVAQSGIALEVAAPSSAIVHCDVVLHLRMFQLLQCSGSDMVNDTDIYVGL